MIDSFILKHKDTNAVLLRLETETCEIHGVEILSEKDIPILGPGGYRRLYDWLDSRAIPSGRAELEDILGKAGCQTPQEYLIKNLALSLSDTYWLCPSSLPDLSWSQVNLFSHCGEILTFHEGNGRAYYSTSPDAALTGELSKEAYHKNYGWYLRKKDGSQSGEGLQNINEAFASLIHERQHFREYVPYRLHFDHSGFCDTCECKYFTDDRHELISAYDVTGGWNGKAESGADSLRLFIDRCAENGLDRDYVEQFLDYQTLTDFLITNVDRHWGNFGILRDPDTLHFLSMAPIFDSGSSMFYNAPYVRNRLGALRLETHGALRLQEDQLKTVHNPMTIDLAKIPSKEETFRFYTKCGVSEEHSRQIATAYGFKAEMLDEFQHGKEVSIEAEYRKLSGV